VNWADRRHLADDTQTGGVALEHMIQLANVVGASPWFCMPYAASDDYVRNFALTVLATLRPDVQVSTICFYVPAPSLALADIHRVL
jgi:hypothetical protein